MDNYIQKVLTIKDDNSHKSENKVSEKNIVSEIQNGRMILLIIIEWKVDTLSYIYLSVTEIIKQILKAMGYSKN